MSRAYDVIVIGGGPAGAACATVLADHGRRVLVLEKGCFPRHHVGESLQPHTYWTFKRIGMLEKLCASPFVRKQSVQFVNADGRDSQPYYFTDREPNEWSITWQVQRDAFDRMMLDNAREHGARVEEGVNVRKVLFDGRRAVGVEAVANGKTREVRADVIVDASGANALLANQLDLRYPDAKLRNAAIYSYFRGAQRDTGRNEGATVIIHTPQRSGWFWFIPLPNDLASIGVVGPPEALTKGRGSDPARTLEAEIARTPGIARRLKRAQRVDRVRVCADFSYRSRRLAGDGWVLVGDAFGFLDPVYSTGVMLALQSGEWAADAIHAALQGNDPSAERLGAFGPRLLAGMDLLRNLVYAFYDEQFSFGRFMQAHPEYRDHLVRLLIGDVFNDQVGKIFGPMAEWTNLPEPVQLEGSTRPA